MPDDTTYVKRYRMELELRDLLAVPELPPGFTWIAWRDELLDAHAEVKFLCFHDEMDSYVFPSLGHRAGWVGTSPAAAPWRPTAQWWP